MARELSWVSGNSHDSLSRDRRYLLPALLLSACAVRYDIEIDFTWMVLPSVVPVTFTRR
jgi:hypothetical protein